MGRLETAAWVAYYRREWLTFLRSARWVEEGCDPASPLVGEERAALVRSYAGLLSAVHRA